MNQAGPAAGAGEIIASLIREVADFPTPGIAFKDLTPVFADAAGLAAVTEALARVAAGADLVAGIDAPGFLLAGAVADRLGRRTTVHVVDWQNVTGLTPSALALPGQGVAQLLEQFEGTARAAQAPERGRMDLRTYGIGAQILRDLNVGQMRLLARPRKMPSMAGFSLTITGYDCDPPNTPATH